MMVWKSISGLGFATALLLAGSALAQTPQVATDAKPGMATKMKTAVPLDINTASVADLQALKGVGSKRAADIVKGRPYKGKDDLVQKKIIPQGVYDGIKDQIIAKQK